MYYITGLTTRLNWKQGKIYKSFQKFDFDKFLTLFTIVFVVVYSFV